MGMAAEAFVGFAVEEGDGMVAGGEWWWIDGEVWGSAA
jgi:hypothetical protein